MSAQSIPRLTPERYLEIERDAEFRSEYFDGEMIVVSAVTYAHSLAVSNLLGSLLIPLRDRGCTVHSAGLRVKASGGRSFTYPDIVVVCGEPRFADDQKDTVVNPVLIVEVLSKSTEARDRGFKFAQYRQIESLKEYAMVSQTEARIEVYGRDPAGNWVLREFAGLGAVCVFGSVDTAVALAEVYRSVALEPSA